MEEEERKGSNRQCSLDPFYTGSQGGTFYCTSTHSPPQFSTPLDMGETPPTHSSTFPCASCESCCMPCAKLKYPKINHKGFFISGREREIWVLPT